MSFISRPRPPLDILGILPNIPRNSSQTSSSHQNTFEDDQLFDTTAQRSYEPFSSNSMASYQQWQQGSPPLHPQYGSDLSTFSPPSITAPLSPDDVQTTAGQQTQYDYDRHRAFVKSALDQARSAQRDAENRLVLARSSVAAAENDLALAKSNLAKTTLIMTPTTRLFHALNRQKEWIRSASGSVVSLDQTLRAMSNAYDAGESYGALCDAGGDILTFLGSLSSKDTSPEEKVPLYTEYQSTFDDWEARVAGLDSVLPLLGLV